MNLRTAHIFRTLVVFTMVLASCLQASAGDFKPVHHNRNLFLDDTTRYPIRDRYGDPYSNPSRNTFDFRDTAFIKRTIEYDPKTKQYYIVEKIGNRYYRTPASFTMEEFVRMQGKKDEEDYFKKRASLMSNMNRRMVRPKFKVSNDWFNRIMGVGPDGKVKIEIKPSGYVDFLAGYQGQNIKNPTLPERARRNGGFDFNMNSQLQMDAQIGEKLKLPINYNTLANFNFENQLKLDFRGKDDDIVKMFQAGNTSFASKGTLIPGAQSLFGIKTQLQFGKLFITTVLANQQSQRQTMGLQGGSAAQRFSLKADEYDENRHFLMSQYFRSNYNTAMKQLPIVNSKVQVLRVEVWVTNRNGSTTDTRDIVAFMDLGEGNPYSPILTGTGDGAGAVLLEPNEDGYGILDSILRSDGSGGQFLHMKAGGSLKPASIETVMAKEHYAYQEGQAVFKFAVKGMADVSAELLERNNLTGDDVAWLVPHQANLRIIDATANRMGLPKEKVMINIETVSYTHLTLPTKLEV